MSPFAPGLRTRHLLLCVLAAGCTLGPEPAEGRRVRPDHVRPTPAPQEYGPYRLELVDELGRTLDTFRKGNRFYVLGRANARYTLRISNPTARRVEAVVSVDGLDVIDGKTADFGSKRGYVIPAYGTINVEGWRTSTSQVAAFRFSSVRRSYAGRKGKARNIGVIGVAFFEERAQPAMVVPQHRPHYRPHRRHGAIGRSDKKGVDSRQSTAKARRRPAPAADGYGSGARGSEDRVAESEAPASPPRISGGAPAPRHRYRPHRQEHRPRNRPGLGTEFGERRHSEVSWTRFVRKSNVPDAMTEMRYNDAAGLQAMGVLTTPTHDPDDIARRETATPFPGTFATPPR